MVCNGGNLTAYQALAGGTPVLGIAGNLDQFLSMQGFEHAGLGRTLRADRFDATELRATVQSMLADARLAESVLQARERCSGFRLESGAAAVVQELIG